MEVCSDVLRNSLLRQTGITSFFIHKKISIGYKPITRDTSDIFTRGATYNLDILDLQSISRESPDNAARQLRLVPTIELIKYSLCLITNMADVQVKNIPRYIKENQLNREIKFGKAQPPRLYGVLMFMLYKCNNLV